MQTVLLILFLILITADGYLTYVGLHLLSGNHESNPIMRWLILKLGLVPALAATRIFGTGVILYLDSLAHGYIFWTWMLLLVCGGEAYLNIRNYHKIRDNF